MTENGTLGTPMDQPAAGSLPVSSHRLVHYGPISDARGHAAADTSGGPVAVLVCHGMGQQVRYETISSVAQALLKEAKAQGAKVSPVEVRLFEANDDLLARAEVKWSKAEKEHEVHIYEAYWAPLTEGKVTYWDAIKFLVHAALSGLWWSKPFMRSKFQRWMFGEPKDMPIGAAVWISLLVVLLVLLLQVGVIAYVALALAQQWKIAVSEPLPSGGFIDLLQWLRPLVPGGASSGFSWWRFILWVALVLETLFVRYFIVQFAGDVAAYISPYKDSKFDQLRHDIRKIGLNVGKLIYGFGATTAAIPEYRRIVMVGHSLGSVVAYDTLNALIGVDSVCAKTDRRDVAARTRALITFGSPLDKTAFIFRVQAATNQEWIREKLAASVQPLIVSYSDFRPCTFTWVNIWSPMDIISGSLEYYDHPDVPAGDPRHVQNMCDLRAWIPFAAHIQYWGNQLLRKQLYQHVSE
jgi:pimeloyl-ACP methyl ester carboxylesterase